MKITILGGGNIGTYFACVCASKGFEVTIYTSKPREFSEDLQIVDNSGNIKCTGKITKATDDISLAMDCDLLFVTYPAFMFFQVGTLILPYIKNRNGRKLAIGIIPGTGGAEFAFKNCLNFGVVLFGLQRVPAVARLSKYGKSVCIEGKRDSLYLAAIPSSCASSFSSFMGNLFDINCQPLPNYFCVTMTPSNPILHTSRLASLFCDYYEGKVYNKIPLFYGEWSNSSSELLLVCDFEHQQILKKFTDFDLSSVKSLVEHYDNSDTPQKMTTKIRSIQSLHNLPTPMCAKDGGWIPNFNSRYFTADFPYGLAIIQKIADLVNSEVPNINQVMQWYIKVTGKPIDFNLKKYRINSVSDLYGYFL